MIREHEGGHPLPGGGCRCVHCGAPMGNGYTYSCLDRPGPKDGLAPEPARRVFASESYDVISARIAELRREREAAANADAA